MNRSDLIRLVARQTDIPRRDADVAVREVFASISTALSDGDRIEIRGFGSFRIRDYDGYSGTNPRTGDPVSVGPKYLPQFRPSKAMRAVVNEAGQPEASAPPA
ncbi:MAG: HU family DNA-binding protein [Myxococcota bacterium]|nr:HU family DNA-binding protein [Myxococcota bacterium]